MFVGDIKKSDLPIIPIDSTDNSDAVRWKTLYNMSIMGVDEPVIERIMNEYDKDYRHTHPTPNAWQKYLYKRGWDDYSLNSNYNIAPDDSLFMVNSVPGHHSTNVELYKYMTDRGDDFLGRNEFYEYYPKLGSGNYSPEPLEYPGNEAGYFNYLDSISFGDDAFNRKNTKDQPKDKERAALYQYWKSRKYGKEK